MSAQFTLGPAKEAPYLTAALLCERVLTESDGALSAIRLVDQLNLGPVPADLPVGTPIVAAPMALALLIALKGGEYGKQHLLRVIGHSPDGSARRFEEHRVTMGSLVPGGVPGTNVIIQMQVSLRQEGIYWFEVRLDGRRVTAIPLRVASAATAPSPQPSQGSGSQTAQPRQRAVRSRPSQRARPKQSSKSGQRSSIPPRQAKRR